MPKRSAAEAFTFFSALLMEMIPPQKKKEAEDIFKKWSEEQKWDASPESRKKKPTTENFNLLIEKYLKVQAVPNFFVKEEDFSTAEKSVELIKKLCLNDQINHRSMLQSAVLQGRCLKIILEASENKKKLFVKKLKDFEISYEASYAYFLIKLYTLISPYQRLLNSSMPISFVKKHFQEIEKYICDFKLPACEQMDLSFFSFGSHSPQTSEPQTSEPQVFPS